MVVPLYLMQAIYGGIWMQENTKYPKILAKAPVKNTLFAGISLYPNPAQDEISVKLSDNEKISRIKITDIGGRMVYNNASETTRINTSAYPNGLYLIRIETTAGKDYTGKFVVNK